MKKFSILILLLSTVMAFSACNSKKADEVKEPVAAWTEADVSAKPVDAAATTATTPATATPAVNPLGDIGLAELTQESLNTTSSVLPKEKIEELEFGFGTPIDTGGNTMPLEAGTPLETGKDGFGGLALEGSVPLEKGTGAEVPVAITEPVVTPEPPVAEIKLEVDEEAMKVVVDEELSKPGDNLAKTDDIFSPLALSILGLCSIFLLKLFIDRRKVGA